MNRRLGVLLLVADEARRAGLLKDRVEHRGDRLLVVELAALAARLGELELRVEARVVHQKAVLLADDVGEIEREAEGVVELERHRAGQGLLARAFRRRRPLFVALEELETALQGGAETLFFLERHLGDEILALDELGIRRAHDLDNLEGYLVQERLVDAQAVTVTDAPAHDAAENVRAPVLVGEHALADEERRGPRVIRDDAHRDVVFFERAAVGLAADARRLVDERTQEIGVVIAGDALHRRADALEAHAGVHRLRGQGHQRAVLEALELHEDVVPDLHPARAVRAGLLIEAAEVGIARAHPVVDLGAGAAGAGVAHRPEVVLGAHLDDALGTEARDLGPDRRRLVVGGQCIRALEDGDHELVFRQAVDVDDELPGPADRVLLEVVPE